MEPKQVAGMFVGYYLSRFDDQAYTRLSMGTKLATHDALGERLGVPGSSIKNWRDEFDPIHDNARHGWHKRAMRPSRARLVVALGELDHEEVWSLVEQVLAAPSGPSSIALVNQLSVTNDDTVAGVGEDGDSQAAADGGAAQRARTGAAAELWYVGWHERHGLPQNGQLVDCRLELCGYDYRIDGPDRQPAAFVEVKGLFGTDGGISLTAKEWRMARQHGDSYYLAIVRGVGSKPSVQLVRDPAARFQPCQRVYTVVRVEWAIGSKALREAE